MNNLDLDLLIESERMRTILMSLKQLSTQSDGVMVNGSLISWGDALPLLHVFPDASATENQKKEWMNIAAISWESDYKDAVKSFVKKTISEESTLENDNLYMWSLLNATDQILRRVLDYANSKALHHTDPNTLSAAKDLQIALGAVVSGATVTGRIRSEIFISGIDNVIMEFKMLHAKAQNDGREEEAATYLQMLTVIRKLKEQTAKDIGF